MMEELFDIKEKHPYAALKSVTMEHHPELVYPWVIEARVVGKSWPMRKTGLTKEEAIEKIRKDLIEYDQIEYATELGRQAIRERDSNGS